MTTIKFSCGHSQESYGVPPLYRKTLYCIACKKTRQVKSITK